MSGVSYSTITVDEREYNRLRSESNRAKTLASELNRAREEMNRLRNNYEREIEELNFRYTTEVQNLRTNLKDIESKFNREINELHKEFKDRLQFQEREFNNRLKEQGRKLMTEIRKTEERINNRIDAEVEEINNKFKIVDNRLDKIDSELNQIKLKEERMGEYARNFLNDLKIIIDNIDREIPHNKYFPGKLDEIKMHLRFVENNIKSGFYQSAISTAQSIYMETLKLRKKVIEEHEKYLIAYQTLMQELTNLKGELIKSKYIELDGEKLDIDFWTDNKIEQLNKEVDKLIKDLERNKNKYKVDDIKRITEDVEKLKAETPKIIEEGILNIQLSQMKAEVADYYEEIFKKQGFFTIKRGYANDNPKDDYYLYMKNQSDEEVIVKIYLDNNKEIKVETNSFFKFNTLEFALEREKDILKELNETGIVNAKHINASSKHNNKVKEEIKEKLKI